MTWNYRVVRSKGRDEEWLTIHEVYYDEDGSIEAVSKEAIEAAGESHEALRNDLDHMREALTKPVLENTDLPWGDGRSLFYRDLAGDNLRLTEEVERLEKDINEWKTLEAKARGEVDVLREALRRIREITGRSSLLGGPDDALS